MLTHPRVSVIVPALNEQDTITLCLERVLGQKFVAEVIVINDGSQDGTVNAVLGIQDSRVRLVSHSLNRGKGASIRTAIPLCTAQYIAIQDADLEYDPADMLRMLEPLDSGEADVVFGSRFLPVGARRALHFWHTLGNKALTLACNMVSNLNLTDMETCYKMFRREALQSLVLEENRFGIEPELTIKSAASGFCIYEVGISYRGRTYAEGKKIGWRDGFSAARCIIEYGLIETLRKRRLRKVQNAGDPSMHELHESLEDLQGVDNYYDWIFDLIQEYLGDRVLEIGAGVGTFSRRLATNGRTVFAVEPSSRAFDELDVWQKEVPGNRALAGTLMDVAGDLEGRFNSIVLVNVLEHIKDEAKELRLIWEHLEPGGHLIVWVPAHEILFARFDLNIGHFRRYSKRRLEALATSTGFEVIELRYMNPIGAVGWMVTAKALKKTPTASRLASTFDNFIVPVTKKIESKWQSPFGQSALLIARKPLRD